MQSSLTDVFTEASRRNWCTKILCTTCGAREFRTAIREWLANYHESPRGLCFNEYTFAQAGQLLLSIQEIEPPASERERQRWDQAIRFLLFEIWRSLGGNAALEKMTMMLSGSWSGSILARMIAHEQERKRDRQLDIERNNPEKANERRVQRRLQRQQIHGERMELQKLRSKLWHERHGNTGHSK